jgi:putative transposase
MKHRLKRIYGAGHLHFITCSCYQRRPLLGTAHARDIFLKILDEVRKRYDLGLTGHTVMPEHIHLLMSEPNVANLSTVMQALKLKRTRRRRAPGQLRLWEEAASGRPGPFWQGRFYDFNVWSWKKKNEKLNYMHFNPVKRGLVKHPKDWKWSSFGFYSLAKPNECPPNPRWEAKPKPRAKPRGNRGSFLTHPSRTS